MSLSKSQRKELKQMFGGRCAYCGKELGLVFHSDHCKPIERVTVIDRLSHKVKTITMLRPENDTIENQFPSCKRCNIAKSSMNIEQFRKWIAGAPSRIVKYENPAALAKDFGLLEIKNIPVIFWFEKYKTEVAE